MEVWWVSAVKSGHNEQQYDAFGLVDLSDGGVEEWWSNCLGL